MPVIDNAELELNAQLASNNHDDAEVSLYVACCSEFHEFSPMYEGYKNVQDAVEKLNEVYPIYQSNIPSIGINIHTPGTEVGEDVKWDILVGRNMDMQNLTYVPEILENEKAMDLIAELSIVKTDIEIWGECKEFDEALSRVVYQKFRSMAEELDQFLYDIDTYGYNDSVEDREANILAIEADLQVGKVDDMEKYLNDYIAESLEDGLSAVMSGSASQADIDAIQNLRKAKELLEKLDEYKPLAKIEEQEEENYNMIDNRLNNGFGEKQRKEEAKKADYAEKKHARISIKAKLEEKKVEVARRDHEKKAQEKKKQQVK